MKNFVTNLLFPPHGNHPLYFRILELIAVPVFLVYIILFGFEIVSGFIEFFSISLLLISLACLFLGYLMADFVSGFVHFLGDSYGTVDTPFFGKNFIAAFREHHVDEQAITRHDFVDVNGSNCIGSVLVIIPAVHLLDPGRFVLVLYVSILIFIFLVSLFLTNQFHKWAHLETRPKFITWLQRRGIILSPLHHSIHHTSPFDTYFCITAGWLNPLLQKIKFFEAILFVTRKKIDPKFQEIR